MSFPDFLKLICFKKWFHEHHQTVKLFGSRSCPPNTRPDLGLNCLQRWSADEASRQRIYRPIDFRKENVNKSCIIHQSGTIFCTAFSKPSHICSRQPILWHIVKFILSAKLQIMAGYLMWNCLLADNIHKMPSLRVNISHKMSALLIDFQN